MNLSLILLLVSADPDAASVPKAPVVESPQISNSQILPGSKVQIPQASQVQTPQSSSEDKVEREIVYQKEQVVDLTGTEVEGERQLPPAFFVTKSETTNARSLLEERLRFELRNYNRMGF